MEHDSSISLRTFITFQAIIEWRSPSMSIIEKARCLIPISKEEIRISGLICGYWILYKES
jgi:hypothetical protein